MDKGVCRLCLQRRETTFPMLYKVNGISPLEKLMKCKLKTTIYKSQSSVICSDCNIELNIVVNFLRKCEKSYEFLNAYSLSGKSSVKSSEVANNIGCDADSHVVYDACDDLDTTLGHKIAPSSEHVSTRGEKYSQTYLRCEKILNNNFVLHTRKNENIRPKEQSRYVRRRSQCVCPVPGCGKIFSTNTNLNTHISSHTGEKPYKCGECEKRFVSKNTLRNHLKIHAGVKPYLCNICGARFTNNRMAEHLLSHTNDKPFDCDVAGCHKSFKSKLSLRIHTSTTHRSDAVCCSFCPAKYKHSQSLRKHLRKKHGYKTKDNEASTET